jgi:hypothetical protein
MKQAKQSTGGVAVIRIFDPAVAVHDVGIKEEWNAYALTRDPALIPKITLAGQVPTTFHVQKATRKGMRHIRAGADAADRNERAFAVCVSKVAALRVGDRRTDIDVPDHDGAEPMSDAILERFAESDIQEIGSVAYGMSFLAPDLPPHYPPPPTSWRALEALMSRPVAPTIAPTTSAFPPSSASPQVEPDPRSSAHGAEPTAAIAAAP